MPHDEYLQTWESYQAAWADIGNDERRALLEKSVARACAYADPAGEANGLEELIVYIGKFQQQFAGAYFENDDFSSHHGQAIAAWRRLDRKGSPPAPGHSYACFGDDGKLVRMTGFPQKSA